jgi:hypothetical protein
LFADEFKSLGHKLLNNMETKVIEKYLGQSAQVENHRFNSWKHCYDYFGNKDVDEDLASLHLAFYLASWGMYRGSTFLLQRDYQFLTPAVEIILDHKELRTRVVTDENKTGYIKDVFSLVKDLKSYFKQKYPDMKGVKEKEKDATDTLITKIMLGTLGITPAYDQYFKDGVKIKKPDFPQSFNESSFGKLIAYTLKEKESIEHIKEKLKIDYPIMKIVDMYFWQTGYNNRKTNKK